MNRIHIHISVEDLDQSVQFYTAMLETSPSVQKEDYAKWLVEEPAMNLAISSRCGQTPGVNHLGIQTDSDDGLEQITERLSAAQQNLLKEHNTNCCYAKSNKTWVEDPSGVKWETFYTHGESTKYGEDFAPQ